MMKAGKYYVGDLCYVLEDRWDEFCEITIKDNRCLEGEFELADGTRFATFGTTHGDGQYEDQYGNKYGVDSGLIGCILVDDIKMGHSRAALDDLGAVFDFTKDFQPGLKPGGIIAFDHIEIETDPREEEE